MATLNGLLKEARSQWPGGLSEHQYSTLNLIAHCRSGVLGSISEVCGNCGHSQILPQSCGNRHCPLCLGGRAAQWSERVVARLPDAPHFHVVFTLPQGAAEVMRENYKILGDIFFDAVNRTLKTFMRNNFDCKGGFLCVMHTWGSNLHWHPHIHTIVSGGGHRLRSGKWMRFSSSYLFPVRALSRVFGAIFLRQLEEADARGAIAWSGELADARIRRQWRRSLAAKKWVVYCEPTSKHTRCLVRYLARYTSRAAISNSRIQHFDAQSQSVSFTFKDYRDCAKQKVLTLPTRSFIARFAQHIAPRGFRRIRYYGFLARSGAAPAAAHTASNRPCPRCQATRWTRGRIPANILSTPDALRTPSTPSHSEKSFTSPSLPIRSSFPLQARAGPPNESNHTMKLSPATSREISMLSPAQLI